MKYLKLFENIEVSEDEESIIDLFNSIVVDELYMSRLTRTEMNTYDGTERIYCIDRYNKNRTRVPDKLINNQIEKRMKSKSIDIPRIVFDLSGDAKYITQIKPLLNNFSERLSAIGFKNTVQGTYFSNNNTYIKKEIDDMEKWYGLKVTVWL